MIYFLCKYRLATYSVSNGLQQEISKQFKYQVFIISIFNQDYPEKRV